LFNNKGAIIVPNKEKISAIIYLILQYIKFLLLIENQSTV